MTYDKDIRVCRQIGEGGCTGHNARLSLIDWLTERYENCIAISATKSAEEAAGWMDDASYFREAIEKLESVERYWGVRKKPM